MRGVRVLAAAVLLLAALVGAQAFYLPGVAPRDYAKGAETNKQTNANRQSGVQGRRRLVSDWLGAVPVAVVSDAPSLRSAAAAAIMVIFIDQAMPLVSKSSSLTR